MADNGAARGEQNGEDGNASAPEAEFEDLRSHVPASGDPAPGSQERAGGGGQRGQESGGSGGERRRGSVPDESQAWDDLRDGYREVIQDRDRPPRDRSRDRGGERGSDRGGGARCVSSGDGRRDRQGRLEEEFGFDDDDVDER